MFLPMFQALRDNKRGLVLGVIGYVGAFVITKMQLAAEEAQLHQREMRLAALEQAVFGDQAVIDVDARPAGAGFPPEEEEPDGPGDGRVEQAVLDGA